MAKLEIEVGTPKAVETHYAYFPFMYRLGNGDLFLGAVRWLGERQDLVSIRPRPRSNRPVVVSRQQGRALMVLLVGLTPLGVLAAGAVVWWRRR
jgi:ABC-type uncharacterized transport system involved in gliding motility auxiliary subunit